MPLIAERLATQITCTTRVIRERSSQNRAPSVRQTKQTVASSMVESFFGRALGPAVVGGDPANRKTRSRTDGKTDPSG